MDLLILAALAIFIFFKLNKKLGEIDDEQKRDSIKNFLKEKANYQEKQSKKYSEVEDSNIVNLHPEGRSKTPSNEVIDIADKKILDEIDPKIIADVQEIFTKTAIAPNIFINGAKKAFEMITENFSKQELSKVKKFISAKIYQQFQENIDKLKENNQKLTSQIITIDNAKIIAAKIDSRYAYLTVEFKSQQIDYIIEGDKIINGSSTQQVNIIDKWVFKKNITAKNPAWLLSAIL